MPFDTSISAKELATTVDLPEDIVARSVRYAIGNGIFCEPRAGMFAHNASSALLAHNEHLRNIALTSTHELSYILLRLPDALKLKQEKGCKGPQAAFNVMYPEYHNIFEFLSKDPAAAQRYHQYMVGRMHTSRWTITHLLNAYDWTTIGANTIMDVCLQILRLMKKGLLTIQGWWIFWSNMSCTRSCLPTSEVHSSRHRSRCIRSRA